MKTYTVATGAGKLIYYFMQEIDVELKFKRREEKILR